MGKKDKRTRLCTMRRRKKAAVLGRDSKVTAARQRRRELEAAT